MSANNLSNFVLFAFGVGLGVIGASLIYRGHPHIGYYALGMQAGCALARFVLLTAVVPPSPNPQGEQDGM
jgi:hypothetical protein